MTAITRFEEWDVHQRLGDFNLTQNNLVEVVRASAAAYGGATDNDPPGARGFYTYSMGVRRLREVLRPEGWDKDDTNNFSTTVNHKGRIRIACVRTDDATGIPKKRSPQNRSPKGPVNERATMVNQLSLPGIDDWREPDGPVDEYQTWHLCIYVEGDAVRAELARFNGFEDGHLTDCHERIILLGNGDWEKLDLGDGSDDLGPEFDINIKRNK
jgi:hypothetical protein